VEVRRLVGSTNGENARSIRIGLIKAGGTGVAEVGETFEKVLGVVSGQLGIPLLIRRFGYTPKTYHELKDQLDRKTAVETRESADLVQFCRQCYTDGYRTIFQTATNAGTLYRQRIQTEMAKAMLLETRNGRILVFREQSQGFYAVDAKKETTDRIEFVSSFCREKFFRTLDAAMEHAHSDFGAEPFSVRIVYKFHLFDGFEGWVRQYVRERGLQGLDLDVVQPDTGYDHIVRKIPRDRLLSEKVNLLCVVGNEIGDLLTEALPNHFGIGDKATMYAVNVSLEPRTRGLRVVQTIHGSADTLSGQDSLNPLATIRAAAYVLETEGGLPGVRRLFEEAIAAAAGEGYVTADMQGSRGTREVVGFILDRVLTAAKV